MTGETYKGPSSTKRSGKDECLPKRDSTDLARVLAGKAEEDATVVRLLSGDSKIADSIIGFHAQQAVEKWLKAALAIRGLPIARTHDLTSLVEQLKARDVDLPFESTKIERLTAYAVPLRYDELLDSEPLDRADALATVELVAKWASTQFD
jgi:HEPN domain-containing protein